MAGGIALLVSVGWFAVYQLFPGHGSLSWQGNPLYLDACQHIFRLYMLTFFLYGLHMATSSFSRGSASPSRPWPFPWCARGGAHPLALLLSRSIGFDGALLAAPIADVVSFVLSLALVIRGVPGWRKKGWLE